MQAAFQRHTDNAVSKTVNFANHATKEDVYQVYWLAYREGCKGVTIYRDGSKQFQVLSVGSQQASPAEVDELVGSPATQESEVLEVRARPKVMQGVTERIRTGHGTMYITINEDEYHQPFEVFSTLGKAGGCDSAQLEAISRLTSLALRSGVSPDDIIDQLRGITCCPTWDEGVQVKSSPDAVALALARYAEQRASHQHDPLPVKDAQPTALGKGRGAAYAMQKPLFNGNGHAAAATENGSAHAAAGRKAISLMERGRNAMRQCPDCSAELTYQEGCVLCPSCGFSKC
jgi:ribonucleoside-diphosphate reductase alpha chain